MKTNNLLITITILVVLFLIIKPDISFLGSLADYPNRLIIENFDNRTSPATVTGLTNPITSMNALCVTRGCAMSYTTTNYLTTACPNGGTLDFTTNICSYAGPTCTSPAILDGATGNCVYTSPGTGDNRAKYRMTANTVSSSQSASITSTWNITSNIRSFETVFLDMRNYVAVTPNAFQTGSYSNIAVSLINSTGTTSAIQIFETQVASTSASNSPQVAIFDGVLGIDRTSPTTVDIYRDGTLDRTVDISLLGINELETGTIKIAITTASNAYANNANTLSETEFREISYADIPTITGGICAEASECAGGYCIDNRCSTTDKLPAGVSCSANNYCASSYCTDLTTNTRGTCSEPFGTATVCTPPATLNPTTNLCETQGTETITCTAGTFDPTTNTCLVQGTETVTCTTGTFDPTLNTCLITGGETITCTAGTYDLTTNTCLVQGTETTICTTGTFDPTTNNCLVQGTETVTCTTGTYNGTDCIIYPNITTGTCPTTFTLENNICVGKPNITCQTGSTLENNVCIPTTTTTTPTTTEVPIDSPAIQTTNTFLEKLTTLQIILLLAGILTAIFIILSILNPNAVIVKKIRRLKR